MTKTEFAFSSKTTFISARPTPAVEPVTHYCYSNYRNPVVGTFAGTRSSTASNVPLLGAKFDVTSGITLTAEGNFVVSEYNAYQIRLINISSQLVSTINIGSGLYTNLGRIILPPAQLAERKWYNVYLNIRQ